MENDIERKEAAPETASLLLPAYHGFPHVKSLAQAQGIGLRV